MTTTRAASSQRWLSVIAVLFSIHFSIAYATLTRAMVTFDAGTDLRKMGGPIAYRMLMALIWHGCIFVFAPLHRRFPGLHMPFLHAPFASNEDWFICIFTFAAMLGTVTIARRMLRRIDSRPGFEWMALSMVYMAYFDTILVLNRNLYYPYDIAALFFFTALTYLAYRGRPVAFALVLLPAMVNKETAALAILVYFGMQATGKNARRALGLCFGFGVETILIRIVQWAYLNHICAGCATAPEHHVLTNLAQMLNPLFWASVLSVFGYFYVATAAFWRYTPLHARRTLVVLSGLWLVTMMVTGVMREIRVFSELSAVLLLVTALGVHGWLKSRSEERPENRQQPIHG